MPKKRTSVTMQAVMETNRNTFFKSTASVASMICHKIIIAVMTWKTKAMMYEKAHVQTAKIWIALATIHMHMLAPLRYFHSSSISAASEDVCVLFRDHPYNTSAYGLGGWVQKMAIVANFQYDFINKLRRPHKLEKISHLVFTLLLFSKQGGRFFSNFVAFSQYLNFTVFILIWWVGPKKSKNMLK